MDETDNVKSLSIENIKQMMECPKFYLANYFENVKSKIDIEFVKLRLSLNDEIAFEQDKIKWLKLIDLIDKCQAKCINNKIPSDLIEQTKKKLDNFESKQIDKNLHKERKRLKHSNQQDANEIEQNDEHIEIKAIKNKLESFLLSNDSILVFQNFKQQKFTLGVEEGFTQSEIEK